MKTSTRKIREKMFSTLDLLNGNIIIIESLRVIEGVIYSEDIRRDKIIFSLPLLTNKTNKINPL